jgi:hypothetical protein
MNEGGPSNRPTPRTPAAMEAELRRRIRLELTQARAEAESGQVDDTRLAAIIASAIAAALGWHSESPEHTRNATQSSRNWRPAGGPRGGGRGRESDAEGDSGDRPPRSFGDRPPRTYGERPPRAFGDRPPRAYGDRPPGGERPPRPFGERPPFDYGQRPPRSPGDANWPEFSDRDVPPRPRPSGRPPYPPRGNRPPNRNNGYSRGGGFGPRNKPRRES